MKTKRNFLIGTFIVFLVIFFRSGQAVPLHAQTDGVTPTLYCLGSCEASDSPEPSTTVSPSPTNSASEPTENPSPTESATVSAVPTIASAGAMSKKHHRPKKHHKKSSGISRFFGQLLRFIIALINLIWHLLGNTTTVPSPSGTITPSPSSSSEVSPTISSGVSVSPTSSASIPTSAPKSALSSVKPSTANTGAQGAKLTVSNGDQTYSQDNQVISNVDVHGKVMITGKNITLKSAIVRGPNSSSCVNGAVIEVKGTGVTIQDTEVVPSHPTACLDGVWASNAKLIRMNIHGSVDGVKAESNTTIQDSYIHNLSWFASDPNQGGGPTHNDGVQTLKGSNITLSHNTIDLSTTKDGNAAWQVTQDFGATSTLHAENNWLDGGGCTLNISHKGGSSLRNIWVLNNRFGHHQSFSNCAILISTQTVLTQNSGNVWDDTGAAIPKPQQHD